MTDETTPIPADAEEATSTESTEATVDAAGSEKAAAATDAAPTAADDAAPVEATSEATSSEATSSEAATEDAATEDAATEDAAPVEAAPAPAKAAPPKPEPVVHPPTDRPFLLVTALVDAGARAATATMSHGDAMERALGASEGAELAGLDLVELTISPAPFGALRKALSLSEETVALYDVFPLAKHLSPEVRKVAGQFLAAEAVWTLEDQGLLGGVPLNARLDLPKGWERDPKTVHTRLVDAGALNLSTQGIETFKKVKGAWDAAGASDGKSA